APSGTSFGIFGGFPYDIAGKTGTVERDGQLDQSWYVALAPYDNPKVVIAATVEGGGFGADTAAPIVRGILSAYFDVKPKDVKDVAGGAAGAAE
ncbi:MAG: penicillin-binding protein 2, partial [Thermoleophilia bacterium]|nr:penicillin-binding protein 2 [Thermoleophilia bacterium]